ncbi:MAG TPA: DMT family transporter [Streptosporangiaceae bacterium]|nr:DMT family transporter [Streptosporangiaceae bacterium]
MTVVRTGAARADASRAGLALAVLSAATFATSGTFGSSLVDTGWSPAAAVLARIAVSALLLTIPAVLQLRGRWWLLRREARRATAYGLVAVAGCQLFYFNAIARIPVGVALLLEYLGTILVVGWLWLRHGQRPRRLTVGGAVTAIAGLIMVLNLTGSTRIDPLGVMWGLLAATGLAAYFLLSAGTGAGSAGTGAGPAGTGAGPGTASADEPLPPVVMAWAGMCVGTVSLAALGVADLLPMRTSTGSVDFVGHHVSWIVPVLGLSLVATVVAYLAGIGAARRLGAKLASFIGLAEVMFAIVFAWLLLGQLPSPVQFLGGALILAGVTLVRVDELRGSTVPTEQHESGEQLPELAESR